MSQKLYKATETFFSAESPVAISREAILPEDHPVVKAHPEFFVPVEDQVARSERVWETATAEPTVAKKRAPKRDTRRSED